MNLGLFIWYWSTKHLDYRSYAPHLGVYSVSQANPDSPKNMLLFKNPQFLPNHYETLSKWGPHENLILAKFRNYWVKIVDFLIKAYFWVSPDSPGTHCTQILHAIVKNRTELYIIHNAVVVQHSLYSLHIGLLLFMTNSHLSDLFSIVYRFCTPII